MGVLVKERDGAGWDFRKPERPVEVVAVRHPGLVAAEGKQEGREAG